VGPVPARITTLICWIPYLERWRPECLYRLVSMLVVAAIANMEAKARITFLQTGFPGELGSGEM